MRRLATPAWLACHVITVGLVVLFLRLGWWQLTRAAGGNSLSIGYTLEWPAFAIFVIVVWWREVRGVWHKDSERRRDAGEGEGAEGVPPTERRTGADAEPAIAGVVRFDLEAARAERAARIERYRQRASEEASIHE